MSGSHPENTVFHVPVEFEETADSQQTPKEALDASHSLQILCNQFHTRFSTFSTTRDVVQLPSSPENAQSEEEPSHSSANPSMAESLSDIYRRAMQSFSSEQLQQQCLGLSSNTRKVAFLKMKISCNDM